MFYHSGSEATRITSLLCGWGKVSVSILCLDFNVGFLSAFEIHFQNMVSYTLTCGEHIWINGFLKHRFHLVTSTSVFKHLCTIKSF